jgi:hypothetical protein
VTDLSRLGSRVGADFYDDSRFDLGQRLLGVAATPALGRDLVRPRVIRAGGGEYGGQLFGLGRAERDGPCRRRGACGWAAVPASAQVPRGDLGC